MWFKMDGGYMAKVKTDGETGLRMIYILWVKMDGRSGVRLMEALCLGWMDVLVKY